MTGRTLALGTAGAGIAAVGAMCGIGGGLFAVPLLHYAFGLALPAAVATSLCLVFTTALSSTVAELAHPGRALAPAIVAALVAGAFAGAECGHWLAERLRLRALRAVFCVALLAAGARLLAGAGPAAAAMAPGFSPDLASLGVALLVGLVAGVTVPLLGVGGGLVAVPALLFALPELGYLGARAASLAMSIFVSARSIQLKMKSRHVDRALALPFSAGALVGAAAGVYVVHLKGAPELAQALLGGVLVVAGARFGWDARRRAEP